MNNKLKFIAIFGSMVFLFAGCQASTDNSATTTNPTNQDQSGTNTPLTPPDQSGQTNTPGVPPLSGSQQSGFSGLRFAKITAINGNNIRVQDQNGKAFTVDASRATVTVNNQTSAFTSLAVGDQISVRGQPSSSDPSTIVAQTIRKGGGGMFTKISAINGNTLTVTDMSGKAYTVDASNATVMVNRQSSSLASLAVGDQIMVRGQPSSSDPTKITAQNISKGMMRPNGGGGYGAGNGYGGGSGMQNNSSNQQ